MGVCMLFFIDSIGLGLVFPILPTLFLNTHFGLTTYINPAYINLLYGIAIALFPFGSIFGMSILGSMSDRFGRKSILTKGVLGFLLGCLLSVFSIYLHNVWLFLLSRFVSGFSSGTYAVCMASIMDISGDNDEQKKILSI